MPYQRCYGNVRLLGNGPCLSNIEKLDGNAMPMVMAMAATGLQVDLNHFARMEKELERDLDKITEDVKKLVGFYVNIDSPQQVSEMLFKRLGLKQARPKMTKGGDRESTENEVLVAIQHDHPVVPMLLDYKELSKLLGTYVRPMPKLARKTAFGEWRMFPNFKTTRVPSGRLCIAEGTPIEIVRDVSSTPKGTPIEQIKKGDLAYTFDGNLNLTLRRVLWAGCTGKKRLLRVHWVGAGRKYFGHLDLTENHEVLLTSGEYKRAKDLVRGDNVCALSRGVNNCGYARLYATGIGEIPREHRFIWSTLHGELPEHIHHKNGNPLDNTVDNLEGMDASTHARTHGVDKILGPSYRAKIGNATRLRWQRLTQAQKDAAMERFKLNLTKEWLEIQLENFHGHPTIISKMYGIDYTTLKKYINQHGIDWKAIARKHKLQHNHSITFVEQLPGLHPVYDLEIEDTHNFIANQLCVHNSCSEPNLLAMPTRTERGKDIRKGFIAKDGWRILSCDHSQIEPRVAAHRSQDPGLLSVYENDEDIYSDFAIAAFRLQDNRYYDETEGKWVYPGVLKMEHRYPAKTCILAALYDVTAAGLLEQMPVVCANCSKEATLHDCGKFKSLWHEGNCQDLLNAFYLKYPGILKMRKLDHKTARRLGYIYCEWGRLLHVAAVHSSLDWVVSKALREVGNFGMQATANGCLKLCMAEIWDMVVAMGWEEVVHPLLQVHDELIWACREDVVEEFGNYCMGVFENCVRLLVPVKAGVEDAQSWGLLKK